MNLHFETKIDNVTEEQKLELQKIVSEMVSKWRHKQGFDASCIHFYTIKEEEQEKGFYDEIVSNLKKEATKLNSKLGKNTIINMENYNAYIATIKALRETLDLINKYDWQLMYSEYRTNERVTKTNGNDTVTTFVKQVAVWEQNQQGTIRNHKIWNIEELSGKKDSAKLNVLIDKCEDN